MFFAKNLDIPIEIKKAKIPVIVIVVIINNKLFSERFGINFCIATAEPVLVLFIK